ncbi:MAG: L,D-transpeptidase family protein [Magnetococcales bacterium]|nr:L,D-transpeptidase family protein [Magnetococcales bacterium]NGZ26299.1 L,D-transpeptidase family protein [Magnetococcales bacterium]
MASRTSWLVWVILLVMLPGCVINTAKLNIGRAFHLPWETAQEDAEQWRQDALSSVKLENASSLPLLRQGKGNDPVGELLKEKSWEQPKVRWAIERYDYEVQQRIKQDFERASITYPPSRLAFLAFKKERRLELWAANAAGPLRLVKEYPLTAFSGELGPKRRAGDGQIPEGIYRITYLNPDSAYHLSMKLNYPNEFDREMAQQDHRSNLGGDIFIHGDSRSIGCLAVGNKGIEELFVITALAGAENAQVIIAPHDFRQDGTIRPVSGLPWTKELYSEIRNSVLVFPRDRAGEETVARQ